MNTYKTQGERAHLERLGKRAHLMRLCERFINGCGLAGYVVGVVGILLILRSLGYPFWFVISLAIIGGLPFGTPIGLVAGLPFMLVFIWLIERFYPENNSTQVDKSC